MSESIGESKFGFKDKAKAEETLKLLEEHDLQYRKLTVRGLLGRAKRVLSMTKAEEKIKNIKEAMDLFEIWLEKNGGGVANKNTKTENGDKVDTVPGLGFKDKEAAEKTLKILKGRDPDYQKLAVKGLIGSSKRVLSGTKNEDKIKCIKDAVKVLEEFLEKFDNENMMRLNKAYLFSTLVEEFPLSTDKLAVEFLNAYNGDKAKGNYKHLRTMYPKDNETSWDIIRNKRLKALCDKVKKDDAKLFKDSGEPTDIHIEMIHWAYSPQPDKLKSYVAKLRKAKAEKRKSSGTNTDSDSEDDDDDDDDVPAKKSKTS